MEEGQNQTEEEGIISVAEIGQVLQSMRLETEASSYAEIAALIKSGIEDILFEDDPILFNAMNSNLAYLYDLSFDNDEHFIEPYMSIFDIHSINTEPFNLGTNENPRILHISKDVTLKEKKEL